MIFCAFELFSVLLVQSQEGHQEDFKKSAPFGDVGTCSDNCGNEAQFVKQLECGPMPNVMAALPNVGGVLCSTPQSLADAHYSSAVQ